MNALRNIRQQLPGNMEATLRGLEPCAVLRQLDFEPDGVEWRRDGPDFTDTVLRADREDARAVSIDGRGWIPWNAWRWDDPCDVFARMNDDDTCEHEKERATVLDVVGFFVWELAGVRGESWEQLAQHLNLTPKPNRQTSLYRPATEQEAKHYGVVARDGQLVVCHLCSTVMPAAHELAQKLHARRHGEQVTIVPAQYLITWA